MVARQKVLQNREGKTTAEARVTTNRHSFFNQQSTGGKRGEGVKGPTTDSENGSSQQHATTTPTSFTSIPLANSTGSDLITKNRKRELACLSQGASHDRPREQQQGEEDTLDGKGEEEDLVVLVLTPATG